IDLPYVFSARAELEFRAGGNPSFNTGVDYSSLLANSIDRDEVIALYQRAGLDLNTDLQTLQNTPRISADPNALHYLEANIIFDGQIHIPVLTLHTKGDGLVLVQNESAPKRGRPPRSEEHTSELQSQSNLVCRLLLEKKKIVGAASAGIPQPAHRRSRS